MSWTERFCSRTTISLYEHPHALYPETHIWPSRDTEWPSGHRSHTSHIFHTSLTIMRHRVVGPLIPADASHPDTMVQIQTQSCLLLSPFQLWPYCSFSNSIPPHAPMMLNYTYFSCRDKWCKSICVCVFSWNICGIVTLCAEVSLHKRVGCRETGRQGVRCQRGGCSRANVTVCVVYWLANVWVTNIAHMEMFKQVALANIT